MRRSTGREARLCTGCSLATVFSKCMYISLRELVGHYGRKLF